MGTDRTSNTVEQKFEEYFDLENDSDLEPEEKFDLYDQYFTTSSEAKAYGAWPKAHTARFPEVQEESATVVDAEPVDEQPHALHIYQKQLQSVDFKSVNRVAVLNELLNGGLHPHIPIGHTEGTAFRLVPNTRLLSATKKINWKHTPDLTILPDMVLGINHYVRLNKPIDYAKEERHAILRYLQDPNPDSTDAELNVGLTQDQLYIELGKKVRGLSTPGRPYGKYGRPDPNDDTPPTVSTDRRRQIRSDRSGESTAANDESGFAFYQLGALHYCDTLTDPSTTDLDEVFANKWSSTCYVLVAKIDTFGSLQDIWVLWDFWADPDDDGQPLWTLPQKFPGTDEFITAAKIADSLADLGADLEIRFPASEPERFEDDFELVGCFRAADGKIVRQWVV